MKKIHIGLFFLSVIVITFILFLQMKKRPPDKKASLAAGKQLYTSYCTPCHGDLGKGDGELAYLLYPKPRNFTRGMFKICSTPSGVVPTDQDLFKTLKNGMPGMAMPVVLYLTINRMHEI
jgi:mono/diheme cytochrome c family protein